MTTSLSSRLLEKYSILGYTDSYKISHPDLYPKGMRKLVSYASSRGCSADAPQVDKIMVFGIQLIIEEYLSNVITEDQVSNLIKVFKEHISYPNGQHDLVALEKALYTVATKYNGKLPIRIKAIPEGTLIPHGIPYIRIETLHDDEDIAAIGGYLETILLHTWAPITTATNSYYIRQYLLGKLELTSDAPNDEIWFKLHDFGGRAVPHIGAGMVAGAGHLVSFMGSDTTFAVMAVNESYDCKMSAYSIPASEHSTTTSYGPDNEEGLVEQMFNKFARPGAIFATVIDSYDAIGFIRTIGAKYKQRLIDSGATWVFRPDSGDPIKMVIKVIEELDAVYGHGVNSKNFKVLNNVRVLQGDGIGRREIELICDALIALGWSITNIAFGLGGGLLQKINRDNYKISLKACAIDIDGTIHDISKSPAVYDDKWNIISTQSEKKSLAGMVESIYHPTSKAWLVVDSKDLKLYTDRGWIAMLITVYESGELVLRYNMGEVRNNAGFNSSIS